MIIIEFAEIAVELIKIDKNQARQNFDEERLDQLAESIQEVGQLQPVLVRKDGDKFILVAGERRYRAIKKNNSNGKIAAIILDDIHTDYSLRQIQLVENLQRQDLDPLERAISINDFITENNLTKKDASKKLGVPRTTLTEWLNILEVKPQYQQAVLNEDSSLTLSHITLAKGLSSRTGDPSKLNQLLDGVLKYNLSRSETKDVVDLFYKYLHLSMDEAIDAILIKRESKKVADRIKEKEAKPGTDQVRGVLNLFHRLGENLEKAMDEVGNLDSEQRESLIDEFLYVYQLLEILVPEFKKNTIYEMINRIKQNSV